MGDTIVTQLDPLLDELKGGLRELVDRADGIIETQRAALRWAPPTPLTPEICTCGGAITTTAVEHMIEAMRGCFKGEDMAIAAACRAHDIPRSDVCDGEEACALLVDAGWTWGTVLEVNS